MVAPGLDVCNTGSSGYPVVVSRVTVTLVAPMLCL